MHITKDLNYMEGVWAGVQMIKNIEHTVYENIEQAINVKQALIDNFHEQFGYSEHMPEFDRNYSYNYGLLQALKESQNEDNTKDKISI
jgi:hypothetical protein